MGSKTQTTRNKTTLPGYLEQTYKGLINAGTAASKRPLRQYSGPRTAGFTPMQQQAFQLTQNAQGMGVPYLNAASQALSNASASVYPTLQQYNMGNLQQYMDPYTQSVIDSTMANINQSNSVAQQGLRGSGMGAGLAPGLGDRMGLAQAELERNQAMARNQTIAGLQSQGFQNAQSQFLGQQQLQAGTMGNDLGRQLQAGSGFAGLGQQAQDQAYQGISQLLQQGGQQQQLGQGQLDQAYSAWQERQNYPKSQIEWLANLAYGSPKGSTTTTQTPGPSLLAQLAGLATTGLGIAKATKRGGPVHMDTGGVAPTPTIAAPMLDQGSFSYQGGGGFGPVPMGVGIHNNPNFRQAGMYINAIPAISPRRLQRNRRPWTIPMPASVLKSLRQIPHFSLLDKDLEANKKSGGGAARLPWQHMAAGGDPWKSPYFDAAFEDTESYAPGEAPATGPDDAPPTAPDYAAIPATEYAPNNPTPAAVPPAVAGMAAPRSRNWGMPLIYAGLGMMASSSPFPLQAIGEGAGKGLAMAAELDKNPVVDDSGPTIRVYYPSERRWEDTGIPSTAYAKLQVEQQMASQPVQFLTPAEIAQAGISSALIAQKGNPFWKRTAHGRDIDFPGSSGGVNVTVGDPGGAAASVNKKLGDKTGERFDAIQTQASKAASVKQSVEALQAIAGVSPQGPIPRVLAERFPQFSTVGAAFAGVAQGLAPDLRVPGTGSQSDIEYAGALARVGKLSNDPQGNQILWEIMSRKADIDMERGAVIDAYQASQGTNADVAEANRKLSIINQKSILSPRARKILASVPPDQNKKSGSSKPTPRMIQLFIENTKGKIPSEVQRQVKMYNESYGEGAGEALLEAQ